MKEIYKDIPGYEWLYQVSNLWNVKSFLRWWRILKHWTNSNWYLFNILYNNGAKYYLTHRLVLLAFNWKSELDCNHKNWDKADNRIENLEYCTRSENELHKYKSLWYSNPKSKKVKQISVMWECIKLWNSLREASRELQINVNWISACCTWRRKTAWSFLWEHA